MSRSIGDKTGKELGVIATPVTTTYKCAAEHDMFVVLGSDGLWDAMENDEVVNFVQHYRKTCKRDLLSADTELVTPLSVSIAQLLCEEARYRWKYIVEDEDVMVDDISAIVLELQAPDHLDFEVRTTYTRSLSQTVDPGEEISPELVQQTR
jgi:serine/threonine protein phosphatase PrpC